MRKMKHFSLKQFKSNSFIGTLILFILIYTSEDTMLFGTFGSPTYNMMKYVVLVGVMLYMMFKKTRVKNESIVLLVFLTILYLISALMSGWLKMGFVYNLVILFAAIIYVSRYSMGSFKESFCRIVSFLSIYSLVIYFVNLSLPSALSFFPTEYNVVGNEFKNCFFSVTFASLPFRNFGIFREPGVFMVYLNTALFFEWFSEKSSTKRIVIYVFTLFTTVSTAGFLIGALIFAGDAIYRKNGKNALITLPLVVLAYYVLQNEDSIYGTLLLEKVSNGGTGTAIIRVASFTVPLEMFLNKPFGVGPDGFNALFPVYTARMYGEAFDGDLATATLFKQLAVYGALVFVFYFTAFIGFVKNSYKNTYLRVLFFIVLFLALGNEDMRTSLLFNMMIAYGLTNTNKKTLCGEKYLKTNKGQGKRQKSSKI